MQKNVIIKFNFLVNLTIVAILAIALIFIQHTSAVVPKVNELVSVDSSEVKGNQSATPVALSFDGRYALFHTAYSLDSNDTNSSVDAYVRDRLNGTTTFVGLSTGGVQANATTSGTHISYDGRYVLFQTAATNLVSGGDGNSSADVYLRDMQSGTTELVSVSRYGNYGTGDVGYAKISSDGRFVAFLAKDGETYKQAFVRDRTKGTTELISKSTSNSVGNNITNDLSMNCDGAIIAFSSDSTNLVSGDTNNRNDIFVVERAGGHMITNVTISGNGSSMFNTGGASTASNISCDGNYLVFGSQSTNFVSGDTNGATDTFRYSRLTGLLDHVSVSTAGTKGNNYSFGSSISGDGRYVAFNSRSTNLVSGDANGHEDMFVRDMINGTTELLSLNSAGSQANGYSETPTISSNGKYVFYQTTASNLVAGDTDSVNDSIISETGF